MAAGDERSTSTVTVVGSANLDQIIRTPRLPAPGETVIATATGQGAGGKGLNQAVAAARMGVPVHFVGAVGRDAAAELLLAHLRDNRVESSHVAASESPTGTAYVMVDDSGENMIVVAPGANGTVAPLPSGSDDWLRCTVLLMQLELPMGTVLRCAREGRSRGALVVLNAAPAVPLSDELLDVVDVLVVNEHECRELAGGRDLGAAAASLARRMPVLLVTRGAKGCLWYEQGRPGGSVAPPPVSPVDTTGAGDTFCGVLAALLATGAALDDAVRHAVTAGAMSTEVSGAGDSAPHLDAVVARLRASGA